MDTSAISHLAFSEQNAEYLFAASADNIRVWNIESNQALDCISVPPKTVSDLKINGKKHLLVSCIQANTVSMYYHKLDELNYDE